MPCRWCSECEGSFHHWMFNGYEYVCKHCSAKGDECSTCFGEGIEPGTADEFCGGCDGEGIRFREFTHNN